MYLHFVCPILALILMVGMVLSALGGRKLGLRAKSSDSKGYTSGHGAIQGAIFALLGLLMAFTFSKADGRFDWRKSLITQEANAIGSSYNYLDLLQASDQVVLRNLFKSYLDSRIAAYQGLADVRDKKARSDLFQKLQAEIWQAAIAACDRQPAARMQLLSSIDEMCNLATTRETALYTHSPKVIYFMLALMALAAAAIAGFETTESKHIPWLHLLCFACAVSLTFYIILDLEFPRFGFIRVDTADRVLIELKNSML